MWLSRDAGFEESDHPRGQPGNAGQFAKTSGGASKPKETKTTKPSKVASREQQYKGIDGLAEHLNHIAKLAPKSTAGFILKNGHPYTVNEKTYEGKRAPAHQCYKNATLDAIAHPDHTYVEGYISVHGVPIEHAWTVDSKGQVYDPTIKPGQEIDGYYGVPFSREYVLQASLKNGYYGLLGHNSRKTLEPLLNGKDDSFKVPQSIDQLSDSTIADRLAFANRTLRNISPTDKIDTPERNALRKKIADDLYNKDIAERKHDRDATIVLGLPGAGKSTIAGPIIKEKGALEVDPDLAKAQLPEYASGLGASAVHEESSAITRNVMAQALSNGDNIVWPRVDSPDKIVQDIKNLKRLGYKVHVRMLDTDPALAQTSAIKRFIEQGHYMNPQVINEFGNKPMESYEAAVKSGLLDSNELYRREGSKVTKVESK